jgi:hypothetical protein
MSIWLFVFVAFVGVLTLIALRGFRAATDTDVDLWMAHHDIRVGTEGRASARVYLSWVRPWRSAGLLLGLAPFLKWLVYDRMDEAVPWTAFYLALTVAGYLAGCIVAELTFPAVSRGVGGEAELRPRELQTFIAHMVMTLPWGVAVLAILLLPAYVLVADPARMGGRLAGVIWSSGLVIITAVVIRAATRRIVDRSRPVASSELLRVDHAERSSAIRTILLAGSALELLLVSVVISEIGRALEARPQHTFAEAVSWLTACVVVLAVLTWVGGASDRSPSSLVRRAGP